MKFLSNKSKLIVNNMSKILLIASREIKVKLSNIWFWIATLGLPLITVMLIVAPILLNMLDQNKTDKIAVVDNSGQIYNSLKNQDRYEFTKENNIEDLKQNFTNKGYKAILYIPDQSLNNLNEALIYSDTTLEPQTTNYIENSLNISYKSYQLDQLQVSRSDLDKINKNIPLKNVLFSEGREKQGNASIVLGISMGIAFALYITIFIFGTMITIGVLEEKSSRISEVLLSSVKVFELIMGKILGLALVGLIQLGMWIILFFGINILGFLFFSNQINQPTQNLNLNTSQGVSSQDLNSIMQIITDLNLPLLLVMFIVYFILGYLLYAAWFAAIGASAENTQQANNSGLAWIISGPIVIAMVFMNQIISDPNGGLSVFFSLFPFTSPIVMLARIPFGVPWWQLILSVILLASGFIGSVWIAAKIYKNGILTYGKKANLSQIWKWVRY